MPNWFSVYVFRAFACVVALVAFGALAMSGARAAGVSAEDFDRIGAGALASGKAPGFAFGVVHDGRLVYARGFGLADVERNIAASPDTRFAIGSITKQFTAASILLLAERGRLALDDPVAKYLPDFPNASVITLRMLLNQTSGLHNYPRTDEHPWPLSGAIQTETLLAFLAQDKPDFPPGTRYEYSNANYALLSAVIAKASGLGEAAFLRAKVFEPLGMAASGFGYAAQQQAGVAKPYQGTARFAPQTPVSLDLFSGAGAIVSNVPDLAAWDAALMRGTLLDATSLRDLWTAGTLPNGADVPYAMGFVPATLAGHREVWHNGLAPGAGGYCFNAVFPDDNLAVLVLSNGYDFDGVPQRMVAEVLALYDPHVAAQIAQPAPPAPAPGEDPKITERAKDWWNRLQTGTVDLSQVDAAFAQRLTPEFLAQIKAGLAGQGTPDGWIYLGSQSGAGAMLYKYWIRLGGVAHVWSIALTPEGKIAGSLLQ